MTASKNCKGYPGCRGGPWEVRSTSSTSGTPHVRVPVPEREVPITSGCKNQQWLSLRETEGFWSLRQFLLKGLHINWRDLLPLSSSTGVAKQPERHQRHRGRKWTVSHQGESWDRGSYFPGRSAGRGHCCFDDEPLHTELAGEQHIWVSTINLAHTIHPTTPNL